MNILPIKEKIISLLSPEELAYGEILFHNCECQILSQSAVAVDFLMNIAGENNPVEYVLLMAENKNSNGTEIGKLS
jgi:hypothetical protein